MLYLLTRVSFEENLERRARGVILIANRQAGKAQGGNKTLSITTLV